MTAPLIDRLKRLNEFIKEAGLGRTVVASAALRFSPIEQEDVVQTTLATFCAAVTEPEILSVSRDLFASGHFSLAVQESYKAVEKFVQQRSNSELSGAKLMDQVFSPTDPKLGWSQRASQSEKDEHLGYHRLYAGAMLGIRNPCAHEFDWIQDQETALELIIFSQHLLRKAKSAIRQMSDIVAVHETKGAAA